MNANTMKPFYFDVQVSGLALVYADTLDEATTLLKDAGVIVAGNKLRHSVVRIVTEGREEPPRPVTCQHCKAEIWYSTHLGMWTDRTGSRACSDGARAHEAAQ